MEFRVLGQIAVVRDDGAAVPLPSASLRRLVGFLVSRSGSITSAANIGLHLELSEGAVRTAITRLRRRLGGPGCDLVTVGPGYILATDRIDRVRFEGAVHAAAASRVVDVDRRRSLEDALALWRDGDDAYAEFAHEDWAASEVARLEELRARATESLVDVLIALGEHDEALERATELARRQPFRDRPRGQQMQALASMGRVTEALRAFQEYRTLLLDEVGTVPSTSLAELDHVIAAGRVPVGEVRPLTARAVLAPGAAGEATVRRNRAAFGLEEITEQVASDIADRGLITLTGIGGVGKTRLAHAVIERVAADFDRVVFVDLRSTGSSEAVRIAAARALGVETAASAVIVQAVRRCPTLVVLDGCEHVLGPTAELIAEILAGWASVRVLATSRQALGVAGEQVRPVPTLSPDDARDLFIDRASRWCDGFASDDPSTRQQITEICHQLDRIPLALELAAACVAHMSLREIADQLHERLTLLPADPIRLQGRQTLRATMDWSYGLLDHELQSLVRSLSVFAPRFDARAAAAVWGRSIAETLAGLGALVRASLVIACPGGDATRYELLETVRLYAAEKASASGETKTLRDAHADHYASELHALDPAELFRPGSAPRPDMANHQLLLAWVDGQGDPRRLGQLAWRTASAHRADCWIDDAARYLGRDDVVAALGGDERSCYLAASFENANVLGRFAEQLRFAELGLDTATGSLRVTLLRGAASACSVIEPERVASLVDEALRLVDAGDVEVVLELRRTKVDTLLLAGDLDAALAELRELWADVVAAPIDRSRIRPLAGIDLLWVCVILGLDAEASALADDLCRLPGGSVAGWCAHAVVAARAGRRAESARCLLAAEEASRTAPVPLVDNDLAVAAAERAIELDEPERACRLLASVAGGVRSPGSHQLLRHARGRVRDDLGPEIVARIRSETRTEDRSILFGAELRRLRAEIPDQTATAAPAG